MIYTVITQVHNDRYTRMKYVLIVIDRRELSAEYEVFFFFFASLVWYYIFLWELYCELVGVRQRRTKIKKEKIETVSLFINDVVNCISYYFNL